MRFINFLCQILRQPNIGSVSRFEVFSNVTTLISETQNIPEVFHVVWFGLHLIFINNGRPAGRFSIFKIKVFTSELREPFTNNTLSYGTLYINGTYIFSCFYSIFSFSGIKKKTSNGKKWISFSYIFTFSVKTLKIHSP